MKNNIRFEVVFFLKKFFDQNKNFDEQLDNLKLENFNKQDKSLFLAITKGVIRNFTYLENILKLACKKLPTNNLVRFNLLSAVFQLFFLDKIPTYSIIYEAVNFAKQIKSISHFSKFTNAVLKRTERDNLKDLLEGNLITKPFSERIQIQYSLPMWILAKLERQFTHLEIEDIAKHFQLIPKLTFCDFGNEKVNISEMLNTQGFDYTFSKFSEKVICVAKNNDLVTSAILRNSNFYIQDESQYWIPKIVAPQANDEILDLCAAPGGKALHLAKMNENAIIVANDSSKKRLEKLAENVHRMNLKNVTTTNFNGLHLNSKKKFDKIIVDVPCTGSGIIQKNPDIKWKKNSETIEKLAELAFNLLQNASNNLKPNGIIVYSTCSIFQEENELVVKRFLEQNDRFELKKINDEVPAEFLDENRLFYKVKPGQNLCNGAFAVKLGAK